MKTKILTLFTLLFIVVSSEAIGAEWIIFSKGELDNSYYDFENVKKFSHSMTVWVRSESPTEEKRLLNIKHMKESGIYGTDLDDWHQNILKIEIKCSEKQFRILNSLDYDKYGNNINTANSNLGASKWGDIIPNSNGEFLHTELCKRSNYLKKQPAWKLYRTDEGFEYYYDPLNIESFREKVKIWTKSVFTHAGKADMIKTIGELKNEMDISIAKFYAGLQYSIKQFEIDCSKKQKTLILKNLVFQSEGLNSPFSSSLPSSDDIKIDPLPDYDLRKIACSMKSAVKKRTK